MIRYYRAKITDFTQADYTKTYSLLECAIREKIDAKKNEISRMQSIAGYILLYRAIKDLYSKEQFKIAYNEHGKPLCDFCFFSISHSDDMVVCAISDQPIGIDIQQIKEITPRKKYKYFNAKECDYVNQNKDLGSKCYIEIFTKKEAAVKMLGQSISYATHIDTFSTDYCFETEENDNFFMCVCSKKT